MTRVMLIVLDGWGISHSKRGNAIRQGETPFIDTLKRIYPYSTLKAFGDAVGLPKGYQGNSEVGHITIGAGRVVQQMLQIINHSISDGSFYTNRNLLDCVKKAKGKTLHIMGLLQDQGVHSHQDHCFALLKLASQQRVDVKVHVFTDGRDTPPKSAENFLRKLDKNIKKFGGEIATISGRYYAMDRDKRWSRIQKAYQTIIEGKGEKAGNWEEVLDKNYKKGITDEFIPPTILNHEGVKDGDSIVFFNYRLDRARQLTQAITERSFKSFKRKRKNLDFCAFAPYYDKLLGRVAFEEPHLVNTLGEVLSKKGKKQLRVAETEKYAHVTYFFNGQREKKFNKEDRILIPSPKACHSRVQMHKSLSFSFFF